MGQQLSNSIRSLINVEHGKCCEMMSTQFGLVASKQVSKQASKPLDVMRCDVM